MYNRLFTFVTSFYIESFMTYPIFRKYTTGSSYFKIDSERSFMELKVIGKHVETYNIEVSQYPEILFIQDLIACSQEHIQPSTAIEFEKVIQNKISF